MSQNASYARFEHNPARQYAYFLYASDPSVPITEWMPQLDEFAGEKVALRTVQRWRHDDDWEKRLAEEVLASSAVSVFEQVRRLRVAALPAIAYLDQVARGTVKPDRLRMDAAKFLVQQSAAVHQLAAAVPVGNGALAIAATATLDAMTDAELLDYQEKLQRG